MTICRRCVISDAFPGVRFDETGLCSLCAADTAGESPAARRERLRLELEQVYRSTRGDADYDCLVAYSGGKDSSYALWVLQHEYGLRCLAITIDNGFVSDRAWENIRLLTDALGVDHETFKPASGAMRQIYQQSLAGGVHVGAAVTRASAICNSCIGLINNHMVKTALQRRIPIIAGGYLGGQVPKDSALHEFDPGVMSQARQATFERMAERFGEGTARRYYSLDGASAVGTVLVTNPMLVLAVTEAEVLAALAPHGWQRPADTGRHSSNCRLNDLGIKVHLERHGFHPYTAEMAEQVRQGLMSRDEALDRLQTPVDGARVRALAMELGIDSD